MSDVCSSDLSSSSISDGAAATVLMSADEAGKRGLQPIARIVAHATHSQAPEWFTTAPVKAISNVLEKAGWKVDEVDLFEINEAFACIAMAPMKDLGIPRSEEHTSELQSLMRISYAVFCLKKTTR